MSELSPNAILQGMAEALPTHQKDDDSSDLASSYEAIALLIHAYLAAIGFKLTGYDQDKPIPEAQSLAPRIPPQWNNGFGSLSFVYTHKQSSMTFNFRIDRMGGKVEVRGLAVGDEKIYRFEKVVKEVVDSKRLPVRITMTEAGEDRRTLLDKLRSIFVSEQVIADVLRSLKVDIVQKLIPKLQSEGYIEEAEAEANARSERRQQEAQNPYHPFIGESGRVPSRPGQFYPHPGLLPDNARPAPPPIGDVPMPGFEDEHQMLRRPGGIPLHGPGGPLNIGHDDLNPPGLGPIELEPRRPRPGGFSGMHPTFDDPLFTGQGSGHPEGPRQGYDPQVPPGARYDPTGPGGHPRFPGQGGRGGQPDGYGAFGGFGGGGGGII